MMQFLESIDIDEFKKTIAPYYKMLDVVEGEIESRYSIRDVMTKINERLPIEVKIEDEHTLFIVFLYLTPTNQEVTSEI